MTSRRKETFWPPASQLYSPASALSACCTTSCRLRPVASTRTFELELSFLPSLYHVTSVWAWATSQLSVALAPATACTSLHAGCSLANTTEGSGDRGGYTGSETPSQSGRQPHAKTTWMGRWWGAVRKGDGGAGDFSGSAPALCPAEVPLPFSATGTQFTHSRMGPWEYTLGWAVIGTDLSPAHDICKVSRQLFPNIPRWCPHLLHTTMQELFTCSPKRWLRLSALAYSQYCQLVAIWRSACTSPWLSFSLCEE